MRTPDGGDEAGADDEVGPGGLPPDGAAAHVVVADVSSADLDDDTRHHLGRVRRLRAGERFTVTDGAGAWRWCRWADGAVVDGEIHRVARPSPPITVAFALTKGSKPEFVVEKLAELGVDRIVPFVAERSVVRWDDTKAERMVERWQTVARGATAQSGQCWLTSVAPIADVDAIATLGARRLDRDGELPAIAHPVVAVGPEGGWSARERAILPRTTTLGASVLRAETAAVTAGALLCSIRAGILPNLPNSEHGG